MQYPATEHGRDELGSVQYWYCFGYCSLVLTGARVDHNLRHVYLIPLIHLFFTLPRLSLFFHGLRAFLRSPLFLSVCCSCRSLQNPRQ